MKGIIYCLIDNTTQSCYVGSTTESLEERIRKHLVGYQRYVTGKDTRTLVASYSIFDNNNYTVSVLEEVDIIDSKKQLHLIEREWILKTPNIINKTIPVNVMNNKTKNTTNKPKVANEARKEYYANYREKHKERLLLRIECECCGGSYLYKHRSTHFKTEKHRYFAYKESVDTH